MLWLGLIAKALYNNSIGFLLKKSNETLAPNWPAAVLVYFAIVIGIIYFALPKAGNSYGMGFFWGAMLGLVIYGVYDFTNYSLIANWPLKITLIDLVWGMILCGLTTCFAVFIQNWLYS
jgi:uncharacterized membrane protein